MLRRVGRKSRSFPYATVTAILTIVTVSLVSVLGYSRTMAQTSGAGSVVGATICDSSSTINLSAPVSDSIVSIPTVQLSGIVQQASQIEVRIDDVFDGIIPISLGQTSFSSTIQLTAGTHTVKLTAINICSGSNAEVSTIVTYSPPSQVPSTGSNTPTEVDGGVANDVNVNTTNQPIGGAGVIDWAAQPLKEIAKWLNIQTDDISVNDSIATLSIHRAVVVAAGMTLAVVGLSPAVIIGVAQLPVISNIVPSGMALRRRSHQIAKSGRYIGFVILIGALFL